MSHKVAGHYKVEIHNDSIHKHWEPRKATNQEPNDSQEHEGIFSGQSKERLLKYRHRVTSS